MFSRGFSVAVHRNFRFDDRSRFRGVVCAAFDRERERYRFGGSLTTRRNGTVCRSVRESAEMGVVPLGRDEEDNHDGQEREGGQCG